MLNGKGRPAKSAGFPDPERLREDAGYLRNELGRRKARFRNVWLLDEAAETQRKEKIRSTAAAVARAAIVTLWLFAAFIVSALLLKYIHS